MSIILDGTAGVTTPAILGMTTPLPVSEGGTNNGSLGVTAGGVYYGDGTKVVETVAGTTGQVLVSNGASAPTFGSAIVSGTAVASTSGTSIDFTGIPSWVKRITVMFNGVSTSGTSYLNIQTGSGSVTTTGYTGSWSTVASSVNSGGLSTGFQLGGGDAADSMQGTLVLTNISANIWVANGTNGLVGITQCFFCGGVISLSGTLDRVRITTVNGTDTFDAGSINILYE